MVTNQLKNQHLLWRAGFGPMAEEVQQLSKASPQSYLSALLKASSKSPATIDVASNALKGLVMGVDEIGRQSRQLSDEDKRMIRQQSRQEREIFFQRPSENLAPCRLQLPEILPVKIHDV